MTSKKQKEKQRIRRLMRLNSVSDNDDNDDSDEDDEDEDESFFNDENSSLVQQQQQQQSKAAGSGTNKTNATVGRSSSKAGQHQPAMTSNSTLKSGSLRSVSKRARSVVNRAKNGTAWSTRLKHVIIRSDSNEEDEADEEGEDVSDRTLNSRSLSETDFGNAV